MPRSFRSLAVIAVFAVAVPSLHAERAGCDPRPQVVPAPVSQLAAVVYTVVSSLGL